MRRIFSLIAFMVITSALFAQQGVSDSVFLGPNLANRSFYSLDQGEVSNIADGGWDLAFEVASFGSSIRINAQAGALLYIYPFGDVNDWSSADTAGLSSWEPLFDAEYSWHIGAFERHLQAGNPFDLGWGSYNQFTHSVQGDSVYFFKTVGRDWKKLVIESVDISSIQFKYANLDGSNEINASLNKANFSGKTFGYYSFTAGTSLDLEPLKADWDLLFTEYVSESTNGEPEVVSGILSNTHIEVAKADGLANPYAQYNFSSYTFDSLMNVIGYDWKTINGSGYTVQDSLAFFLRDTSSGKVFRLVLEEFDQGLGKFVFHKEQVHPSVAIDENGQEESLLVYPNPAQDQINLLYQIQGKAQFQLLDLQGRILLNKTLENQGFSQESVNLPQLKPGAYICILRTNNQQLTQQLIIE